MKTFKITIKNIQGIKNIEYEIDLQKPSIICIVGKNGVGKTTLIKAIGNYKRTDIFDKTSNAYMLNKDSHIIYDIDGKQYNFYTKKIEDKYILDSKDMLDTKIQNNMHAELPIPNGERFDFFQKLSKIDKELRAKIAIKEYDEPKELIRFLDVIYPNNNRFNNLKNINLKNEIYYFILRDDDYYIREDYFSSGEYFVISIYRLLQKKCKLLVIDEIDISLDSSAQVRLIDSLRNLANEHKSNIVFTTHSLAIMKKMKEEELFYMEKDDNAINISKKSYNHIKSLLFQFSGFDKCILTEDIMLEKYVRFILKNEKIFCKFEIIYIGGYSNVIDLMDRNEQYNFFGDAKVISVLDGDTKKYTDRNDIIYLPFDSVEKYLFELSKDSTKSVPMPKGDHQNAKSFYNNMIVQKRMNDNGIFKLINEQKENKVQAFTKSITEFLN